MAFFCFLYGALFYMVLLKTRSRAEAQQRRRLLPEPQALQSYLVYSFTVALSTFFVINCIKLVPVSVFSVFFNLKPVMVVFVGLCLGQGAFTRSKLKFILVSFLGTFLIVDSQFFGNCLRRIRGLPKGDSEAKPSAILHGWQSLWSGKTLDAQTSVTSSGVSWPFCRPRATPS